MAPQQMDNRLLPKLATTASRDGVSIPAIMRQGRWKQVDTVMEYIEAAQRFEENAAGQVLNKIQ